jgi:hypothetical protein
MHLLASLALPKQHPATSAVLRGLDPVELGSDCVSRSNLQGFSPSRLRHHQL